MRNSPIVLLILILVFLVSCEEDDTPISADYHSDFIFHFEGSGPTIENSYQSGKDGEAIVLSRVDGKIGKAVKFLEVGSKIDVHGKGGFPFDENLTFMMWYKTENYNAERQQIFGASTGGAANFPINNFGIGILEDKLVFDLQTSGGAISISSDTMSIQNNVWIHLALTWDGDQLSFYKNGTLLSQGSIIQTFQDERNFNNLIGCNERIFAGVQIEHQLYGTIDEFYLQNGALSESDVQKYYNLTK